LRAIINIHPETVIAASGWKARAVEIEGKTEATIEEILKAASLEDGRSLYDIIAEGENLKSYFALYINGLRLPASSNILQTIKDSSQIHVVDCS